jgi:hypothetical protein
MKLKFQPVMMAEAVRQVILALILFKVIAWTDLQTAAFLMAISAVLAMFTQSVVVPVATVELAGTSATQLKAAAASDMDHVLLQVADLGTLPTAATLIPLPSPPMNAAPR